MSWFKKLWQNVRGVEDKTVRARAEDGKFVADDKSTSKNEAYKYVHKSMAPAPKKRGRPAKKKVGRPKKDS